MIRRVAATALIPLLLAACAADSDGPSCPETICGEALMCQVPDGPAERGPWPVGARTAVVQGVTTEIWYPAAIGSEAGLDRVLYDVRDALPESEQGKVPDEDNPWQPCDCYRDLPLDEAHGPYPVLVFHHGIAAFRTQSLNTMVHWAGRGFVVLSQDHPGVWLRDMLDLNLDPSDPAGDTRALLAAVAAGEGEFGFLAGHVDLARIGLAGHSAGGGAVSDLGDVSGLRARIPMASHGVENPVAGEQVLVMGAFDDQVVSYEEQVAGYEAAAAPKRLIGIASAGHLVFSDLCAMTNTEGRDLVEIAIEYEVKNASLATGLWDGCEPGQIDPAAGWAIVNHATTAVFEQALMCTDAGPRFESLQALFPLVSEYREEL